MKTVTYTSFILLYALAIVQFSEASSLFKQRNMTLPLDFQEIIAETPQNQTCPSTKFNLTIPTDTYYNGATISFWVKDSIKINVTALSHSKVLLLDKLRKPFTLSISDYFISPLIDSVDGKWTFYSF